MRKRSFVHLFVRMLSIIGGIACILQASALDLTYRPEVVGKVPLGGKGYVVTRNLGSAALAPELTFPLC